MRSEGIRVGEHEDELAAHHYEMMIEDRTHFWHFVDSSRSPYSIDSDWARERGEGCLALRSDRKRCHRPPVTSMPFCEFHIGDALRTFRAYFANEVRIQERMQLESRRRARTRLEIELGQEADAATVLTEAKRSVYFFLVPNRAVKIGYSSRPERRLPSLRNNGGGALTPPNMDCKPGYFYAVIPGGREVEKALHRSLYSHRISGEWFRLSPNVLAAMDEAKRVADELQVAA